MRRTPLGQGVFAERWFALAAIVGEVDGEVIDDIDYGSRYCMDMGDSRCLEPSPPFRYMNHSCAPNCMLQWHDIDQPDGSPPRRRMFVLAIRRIARGEELSINYCWPAHMAIRCRCGAENCRAWIVCRRDLAAVVAANV